MIVPAKTLAPTEQLEGAPRGRTVEAGQRNAAGARVVIFHGVFDGWGWELLTRDGEVLAESQFQFESREECARDARAVAGWSPGATYTRMPRTTPALSRLLPLRAT
jgi:hypothetical protein